MAWLRVYRVVTMCLGPLFQILVRHTKLKTRIKNFPPSGEVFVGSLRHLIQRKFQRHKASSYWVYLVCLHERLQSGHMHTQLVLQVWIL